MKINRILFALLLSSTLATPMDNEYKHDYNASLISILDTYYPEISSEELTHILFPIPAAASPNPSSYAPSFLPQLSPLRTENPYFIPYQEYSEANNSNNFFNASAFPDGGIAKALSVETASRDVTEPTQFLEEKLPAQLSIPKASKKRKEYLNRYTFNFKYKQIQENIGEKSECPVLECSYKAQEYCDLKKHILCTHTNLRPYVCPHPECKREFSQNSNLHAHVKKDHPGIEIPSLSQEVKDLIKKVLAPFLPYISTPKKRPQCPRQKKQLN